MNISTPYFKENNSDGNYIPLAKPSITKKEIAYVNEAMINGWGENKSKFIEQFEIAFAKKTGAKFALATSSCTGALHLGLESLGIKKGDEVIVPESTWIASVAPIVHLGAKPVFVDILRDSWCIDPKLVEDAITPKTRAILLTYLFGIVPDIDKLIEIYKKNRLFIIEDFSHALNARQNNSDATKVTLLAKIKTFMQFLAFSSFLLGLVINNSLILFSSNFLLFLALIITLQTGLSYTMSTFKQ